MVRNIFLYLTVLLSVFLFSIFFYEWFSWYLLLITVCIPVISLVFSLPFMIVNIVRGFSVNIPKEVTAGDDLLIKITPKKGDSGFCPLMRIKFKTSNSFVNQKKKTTFIYSGFFGNNFLAQLKVLTNNCGCIELNAKYIMLYDLMGIFFIPVRFNYCSETVILPKKEIPTVMPTQEHKKIIGYKPKMNGFAEEYEIRNYQRGDSLKNIHWKISARHNRLMLKEPSTPVYRPLILKPILTDDNKNNNIVLGKLFYIANMLVDNNTEFYCTSPQGKTYKVTTKNDITSFLVCLYKNTSFSQQSVNIENAVFYTITYDKEAVSV